ncbi:protein FIP1 [Mercurialis annua]|uniref:protein FIP1 n=1 Tax=Mercurialis annua TaxID=3986 RepID=UPI00215F5C45|nr:protein FIP1 [Mercurialis annua]
MSAERHGNSPSASLEENTMFVDILHEAPLCGHRKRRSVFGAVVYCVILAGYAVLGAIAPILIHHKLVPSLLSSCDVALLIVTGTFQQYFVSQVQKIRLQGYYSFSQKLKHIVRLPFAITAYGTAAMLLVMVWKPQIRFLSISALLRIIMLTEAVCAISFMSVYIGYLHQYNSLDSQPDILKSLYSPLQPSSSLEGLRYHDGGRLSDQQMALLQYQRENLHFMSEEILRLQECLSKYERSTDGSTPQVDLAHMLAAREQELRTVSAEMNQLQTELRLAQSLIAERDSEVQRVRNTNSQYVEENERLRAILGEWSTRAAKLERALAVERLSNLELQKKLSTSRRNQSRGESPEQRESHRAA